MLAARKLGGFLPMGVAQASLKGRCVLSAWLHAICVFELPTGSWTLRCVVRRCVLNAPSFRSARYRGQHALLRHTLPRQEAPVTRTPWLTG